MDARNTLPQQRYIYELELSYAFEQTEKEAVKVLPRPPMYELLYDSPFEAQLWMVFDANKQLMGSGDALYPYPLTLAKGKYTMQVLVRHDTKALLDRLKNMVVAVDMKLKTELTVPVHASMQSALSGGDTYSGAMMLRGSRVKVFVSPPTDKAPGGKHGDVLIGSLKVGGETRECVLNVLVPKEAAKEEGKKEDKKDKSEADLEREEVRDARMKRLKALREDKKWEAYDALAFVLKQDYPAHLPLLEEVMSRYDLDGEDSESGTDKTARCGAAMRAADAVVAAVDVGALASHYGVKHDAEDPAEKDTCKEMDKRKEALLNALLCRVERFIELLAPAPCCDAADAVGSLSALLPAGVSPLDHLKNLWGSVNQWWVAADQGHEEKARYTCLLSQVRRREGRPGSAGTELLKLLKSNEGPPKKKLLTEFIALCEQMGWMHWSVHYKDVQLKQFPAKLALL